MPKYFILGPQSSVFWDPTTRTKIVSSDKDNPTEVKKMSKRMELAIAQKHIVEVPSPLAKESVPADGKKNKGTNKKKLKDMTDAELAAYYEENFVVGEGDMEIFKAMDTKAKLKFLSEA